MAKELQIYEPEENEPPLSEAEEAGYKKAKKDKAEDELLALFGRVSNIKIVIENPEFYDIFIRPIKGNIIQIKNDLETEDKTRGIAILQGELHAYKKMLNFPEAAVDAFNQKLSSLRETMPLFIAENDFAKKVIVTFDRAEYRINIKGV